VKKRSEQKKDGRRERDSRGTVGEGRNKRDGGREGVGDKGGRA